MWSLSTQEARFVQRRSPLLNCNKNCPYWLQTAYFTDSSAVSINSTFPPSAILLSFLGHENTRRSRQWELKMIWVVNAQSCHYSTFSSSSSPTLLVAGSWYIVVSGHSYLFPSSSSSVKYICLFPLHFINHSTRYIIGSATSRLRAYFSRSPLTMIHRQVQFFFCGLGAKKLKCWIH